jgi:RimJ/RimL family protein N-acetyltransferase
MFEVAHDDEGAFAFISAALKLNRSEHQKGIVLRRRGEIIAAALYVEFTGTNIFIHLVGKPGQRWLTRDFLKWGFHYPFVQLGCSRVSCWVEADNLASRRFVEHIGWQHEATLKGAGHAGQDVFIYAMFREDCRYI